MKIVKAGYEIIDPFSGEEVLKKIERVARVCYKSEDKIGEGTAERMVKALVKSEHYAMLEHGSIIMVTSAIGYNHLIHLLSVIRSNEGTAPFIRYTPMEYSCRYMVSGNIRAWLELMRLCMKYDLPISRDLLSILKQDKYKVIFEGISVNETAGKWWEVDPKDLSDREKLTHLDLSVKFTVDRGVSHEIVRHRVASFAQESTRYCNYGKSGDVTFIRPCFFNDDTPEMDNWAESCMCAERMYLALLEAGRTPQEARAVLPNSLKTEVVMTASCREWIHFFNLRAVGTTGKPHPQMQEVAIPLLQDVKQIIPVVFDNITI